MVSPSTHGNSRSAVIYPPGDPTKSLFEKAYRSGEITGCALSTWCGSKALEGRADVPRCAHSTNEGLATSVPAALAREEQRAGVELLIRPRRFKVPYA